MVPVDLQGKIALVTGSGRGLGAYMAVGLAKAGADIVVTSRTKAECDRTAAQIRELGRKAVVVTADVSKLSDITRVVDTAVGEFGKLDILVNNAGTNRRVRALDYCEDDYDLVMATNLKAVYFFAQAAARVMAPRKYGKIVNVASVGGVLVRLEVPNSVYTTTKGAVIAMTKALAAEWAEHNITVNALAPGYFETELTKPRMADPRTMETVMRNLPMGRIGQADDIVGPALFLASDLSQYVTGATLFVDGGRSVL